MRNLKPYRVVITTGTPVVLTQFAPSFDALVYEAMEQATNKSHDDIISEMKSIIKWNEDLGVFHASSMRFIISETQAVTKQNYVRVDVQKDLFRSENFSPNNSRKTGYSSVTTAGGPFKKRVSERLAYSAMAVCFDAVCDEHTVKRLLLNNLVGVGYDGFSSGMGEVKTIEMIELEDDVSIEFEDTVRRNVPVSKTAVFNSEVANTPVIPPYYTKHNNVESYIAERISTLPHNMLTKAI
ncbi:hypothetical protein QTV49_004325 [Vibrio vulnificus]|nr:hypothetical protein [Vibrio vulnificus]